MRVAFTKMHGLGNDFMVLYQEPGTPLPEAERIRELADRRVGVGFDQLLLVQPDDCPDYDFEYRIFNADGGEVEHCGNGARCVARFVNDHALSPRNELRFKTVNGGFRTRLLDGGGVAVDMGGPRFEPVDVPFAADNRHSSYRLDIGDSVLDVGVVSVGNPHVVLWVDDIDAAPVATLGPAIQASSRFPQGVNVGFAQRLGGAHIRLRVYERGVGETRACGTGACAAVAIGHDQGKLNREVMVDLRGGQLSLKWPGGQESIWMTGPAVSVFRGEIEL